MSIVENILQIKSGKNTFALKSKTHMRDKDILYTTLQVGGDYLDCVNVTILYNNNIPVSAKMPHVMYDEHCVINGKMQHGDGSKDMIQTVILYIKQHYPTIKFIDYDDMSSIECASEKDLLNTTNLKRGSNLKPMSLYNLSIAYNGQTWYEKYFGAEQQNPDKHAKYKERVKLILHDKQSKPENFNSFLQIARAPSTDFDELFEYYKTSETYSDFFHSIPKPDRCRILRPWIDNFMRHYLKEVFSNSDWKIPIIKSLGGNRRRHTQKIKSKQFYVPSHIRLNSSLSQTDLGLSISEV